MVGLWTSYTPLFTSSSLADRDENAYIMGLFEGLNEVMCNECLVSGKYSVTWS